MLGNKMYIAMYVKNVIMIVIMLCLVLAMFDVALEELRALCAEYVALSDSLRVVGILGLVAVPAILTKVEFDLIDSLLPCQVVEVKNDSE